MMDSLFTGLLIVVPTRNRADLAMRAVCSVLEQECPRVRVLVSDNSTDPEQSEQLAEFCRGRADGRLDYVQPPESLPMSRHWNWALEQALQRAEVSHVLYLTDRMLFRPGELRRLTEVLVSWPQRVVSYITDPVADYLRPIHVRHSPWTGDLFEFESRELLSLVSRSVLFHPALPKMLNCAVPRSVLDTVRERFGTVFDSISPDYNFGFRCLDAVDSVLYFDRSVIIHYALDRSNGMSFVRGVPTAAHKDFLATLGASSGLRFATPIPEMQTVGNAILHEYFTVKEETGSSRFPGLDGAAYLDYLAGEVAQLENAELREQMWQLLARQGWRRPSLGPRWSRVAKLAAKLGSLGKVVRGLLWLSTSSVLGDLWLWLGRRFDIPPPVPNRLSFRSREEALEFALRARPRRSRHPRHLLGAWRRVGLEAGVDGGSPRDRPRTVRLGSDALSADGRV